MVDISIKLSGPAGSGVFTLGALISKLFISIGYNAVCTFDYPSLIKGGHNICCVRISSESINSEKKEHEILIAFDKLALNEDYLSIKKSGYLFFDKNIDFLSNNHRIHKIDFTQIKENPRMANSFVFGIIGNFLISEKLIVENTLLNYFKNKDKKIQEDNIFFLRKGVEFSQSNNFKYNEKIKLISTDKSNLFMTGNDACCLGAIKAGVKFVAGYPMTPASSFLTFMAEVSNDYNIVVKQTEDEIAAVNMVIGASFAGLRSMTATSGGGFALMTEGLGFAAMSENPIVVFESQRSGPSTGLPTYTEQGDLNFVLNCSQGDFPLVVISPGDLDECFYESFNAFNIADLVQTPVIVLLDKHISGTYFSTKDFDEKNLKVNRGKLLTEVSSDKAFKRYEFTKDGSSARSIPGMKNGIYISSSYEHDETGFTTEDPIVHKKMMDKRFSKLSLIDESKMLPKIYGPKDAKLTLIGWGSSKGAIIDAVNELNKKGFSVNYMHFVYLNPMPKEKIKKMLDSCSDLMIIEGNMSGQFRDLLHKNTKVWIENSYFRYDGRPFFYEDIVQKVKEHMEKNKK